MPIENYKNSETGEVIEHYTQGKLPEFIEKDGVRYDRDYGSGTLNFKFVGSGFYETDYKNK